MPMVPNDAADAVLAAMDALSDEDAKDRQKIFRAMIGTLITYIQANATVATVTAGTATGAVAGGPGVPTVGTGTGSIT